MANTCCWPQLRRLPSSPSTILLKAPPLSPRWLAPFHHKQRKHRTSLQTCFYWFTFASTCHGTQISSNASPPPPPHSASSSEDLEDSANPIGASQPSAAWKHARTSLGSLRADASVHPRPAPLPFASETKPSLREHCPLYKSKSESPPAPPNKAQRPLQQNGTDLTHSHVSDLSLCKRTTPPKADASSNSCTKQVRVEEARESPDGQFFSSHVSPLQRRRSHS